MPSGIVTEFILSFSKKLIKKGSKLITLRFLKFLKKSGSTFTFKGISKVSILGKS